MRDPNSYRKKSAMTSTSDDSIREEMTASNSLQDPGAVLEIDEDGDVHLEIQLASGQKLVRVSAKILSMASPGSKKMLSSKFREGVNQLQSLERPLVPLP